MVFFPYNQLTLFSPLSAEMASRRLERYVEPIKYRVKLPWQRADGYEGTVFPKSFKINRQISYRNDFLPVIEGKFFADDQGITIQLKFRLKKWVQPALPLLLTAGLILTGTLMFRQEVELSVLLAVAPVAVILLFYLIIMVSFNYEKRKALKFLKEVLEAEEEKYG
jgi:hypothetical protein